MVRVTPPPYRVGDRVRFVGVNPFAFNDRWVRPGDVGEIVAVTPEQEPTGLMLDIGGLDGWSTALFPSGCRVAILAEDSRRFTLVVQILDRTSDGFEAIIR